MIKIKKKLNTTIICFLFLFSILTFLSVEGSTAIIGNIVNNPNFTSSSLATSPWILETSSPNGIDPEDTAVINDGDNQLVLQVHDDASFGEDTDERVEVYSETMKKYTLPGEDQEFTFQIEYTMLQTGGSGLFSELTDVELWGYFYDDDFFIDEISVESNNQAFDTTGYQIYTTTLTVHSSHAILWGYSTDYYFGVYLRSNSICFDQYVRVFIDSITVETEYFEDYYTYPIIPTIQYPDDNEVITDTSPVLEWTYGASDAYIFEVQLDGTTYNTGSSSTSWQAPTLSQGVHYWRVRAWDGFNYGGMSAYEYFNIDTIPPGTPSLTSPSNGAILDYGTISFSWTAASDADYYRIEIDGTTYTAPSTTYSRSLSDGSHSWRVQAVDDALNVGSWSGSSSFTIDTVDPGTPTLISPLDGSVTNDAQLTFSWTSASDADYYRIVIGGILYTTPSTSYTCTLSDGTYSWNVYAVDDAGNEGSWAGLRIFTIDTIDPGATSLNSPIDNLITNDDEPTFGWTSASDADHYEIQIGLSTYTTSFTAYSITLADGIYLWRVRAIDDAGNEGAWTAYRTLTIDTINPGTPTLTSPLDDAFSSNTNPTFSWSSVSDVDHYEIEIGGTTYTTLATSYSLTIANGIYLWRVRAIDDAGNEGTWTTYRTLTIDTNVPVITSIIHSPPSPSDSDSITISCSVADDIGVASVVLHYRIDGGSWQTTPMSFVIGTTWSATIGPFSVNELVEYYITATDNSANEDTEDNGGAYYSATISDVTNPIIVSVSHIPSNPSDSEPITFSCSVTDDTSVSSVDLHYRIDGGSWVTISMSYVTGSTWSITFGPFGVNELIEYYVTAKDPSDNEGINNNSGSYYNLSIQDVRNPSITSISHSPLGPTDTDSITITCSVTDDTGITTVTLHYRIDGGSWQTVAMSYASGSTWTATIGPFADTSVIDYYITAVDSSSNANVGTNNNSGSYYNFIVSNIDLNNPIISSISYEPSSPNDTDPITITCSVTDDTGVASVTLHYRIEGGSWQTVAMSYVSGSTWSTTIGAFSVDDLIEYYITAIDSSPNSNDGINNNGGLYYNFIIGDDNAPVISGVDRVPITATHVDTITITCSVTDDTGIASVALHYRIDGGSWQTVAMSYVSGTTWSGTIGTFGIDAVIDYYITAVDSSSNANVGTNNNSGSYYSFTVIEYISDATNPTISSISHTPSSPIDTDIITITCSVTDDTGIASVTLHYRIDGGSWQTVAMSYVSGTTWSCTIGAFSIYTDIEYYITAIDSSPYSNSGINDNSGNYYSFTTIPGDIINPIISSIVHTPVSPTDVDIITISCSVTDDTGVASVTLIYRINGGSWQTVAMTYISGSTWTVTIGTFTDTSVIEFYIQAADSSPYNNYGVNDNDGSYYTFTVTPFDDVEPVISSITNIPTIPTDSDSVTISCSVVDDSDISSVELHYQINGGTWQIMFMSYTSGTMYEAVIGPFTEGSIINYYIIATDILTNVGINDNGGIYYSFLIENDDVDPPTVTSVTNTPSEPTDTDIVTISCSVVDESAIVSVILLYQVNAGSWQIVFMSYTSGTMYEAVIGPFTEGSAINYYIEVEDINGNNDTYYDGGSYYTFTIIYIDDIAPVINSIFITPSNPTETDTVIISCSVADDTGIAFVTLYYRVDGGLWRNTLMSVESGSTIYTVILGEFDADAFIEYYFVSKDLSPLSNTAVEDNSGKYYNFTVLPAGIPNLTNLTPYRFIYILIGLIAAVVIKQLVFRNKRKN